MEGSLDPARLATRLADAIVPRFADFAAVHLSERDPGPEPPAGGHGAADAGTPMRRVASVDAGALGRFRKALPPGEVVFWRQEDLPTSADRVDADTAGRLAERLAAPGLADVLPGSSLLLLPLSADESLLGNVLLVRGADRPPFQDADVAVSEELTGWAAEWLHGTRRSRQDRRIAEELRRSTVPERGGHTPDGAHSTGIELGHHARPEGGVSGVGGDWSDAIPLPRGRTALVVGDVAGHGVDAAVPMSRCKTMVRTLASLDLPPEQVLQRLDPLVQRLGEEYDRVGELLVTCVYVVYDPVARECRYASAGHVPPVLVRPGARAEILPSPAGLPLGVGGVDFAAHTVGVPDGSLLALFTDGLLEAAGRDAEEGTRAVAARLSGPPATVPADLDRLCEDVVGPPHPERRQDDITLLIARLLGAPADTRADPPAWLGRPGHLRLDPADTGAAPDARPPADGSAEPAPAQRARLPMETAAFVGRTEELAEIRGLLASTKTVTLTGPGGVGKSRLARRAAAELGVRFPGGAGLVDLSAIDDPRLVPRAVAEALGVGSGAERLDLDAVAGRVKDERRLLILDGCEHLADACADLVARLMHTAPGIKVLATSRRPLRVAGEQVLVVSPLRVLVPDEADPARADAVALFAARARTAVPGFTLSGADLPAVQELCRRLDGLPLAIELAAARLPDLGIDKLADGLLDGGAYDALATRHQSLRASVDWSHELCEPMEKLLWARLSLFTDDFDVAAAEQVCADAILARSEVRRLLTELVAKSIVLERKTAAGSRYRMLGCVREYGREQLSRLEERETLRRRAELRQDEPHGG